MGHSSWWPVSLRRLHHGQLVSNKPQLKAPIKGSGSVSRPHDDDDDDDDDYHHHNHNKIPLYNWLSAALITALLRHCYRTVRVVEHTHFYDLFFFTSSKNFLKILCFNLKLSQN